MFLFLDRSILVCCNPTSWFLLLLLVLLVLIQRIIARTNVGDFFPMFSSRNFTATGLMFKPLMHFELIFVSDIRQRSNVIFLHVVILFISTQEETIISPLDDTGSLIKLELTLHVWIIYGLSLLLHWSMWCLLVCKCHIVSITIALYYSLKSEIVMLWLCSFSVLLWLLRIFYSFIRILLFFFFVFLWSNKAFRILIVTVLNGHF